MRRLIRLNLGQRPVTVTLLADVLHMSNADNQHPVMSCAFFSRCPSI
ncbi:hypothetical protein GVY41_17620 [Frigidibacter albus]|uniref:Uncharacterized protein n=1 Tax=Frigidibacter albus TaxID=1465486 RepID=A0A6L8VNJ6_9RHOB|nr:hypothetical protein [Frigidibacter albus]MZQ90939.1 hypothetical protein [Frigidibacter albus]NBE32824.1 hypothetical protein [Frigidibacter albus]